MNKKGKSDSGILIILLLAVGLGYYFFIMDNGANNPFNKSTVCLPNWQCSTWSDCLDNYQTRTCTDLNKCLTYPVQDNSGHYTVHFGYPALKRKCVMPDCPSGTILCERGLTLEENLCKKSCCYKETGDFNACYARDIWKFNGCTMIPIEIVTNCQDKGCSVETNKCLV